MLYFFIFIAELVCLFFLSKLLTQVVFLLFLHWTKSHETTIHLLSFLFLPGVIVHELSHMFMASIVFVRVGAIEFLPQIHGDIVKLGSVQIAKTDPFRRFLIGAAPLLGGIGILLLLFIYLSASFSHPFSWQMLVFIYALFEIGNTMFSSKKDMEGAVALLIATLLFFGILFFLGFRFDAQILTRIFSSPVISFFQKLDLILFLTVVVNSIFCGSMKYLLRKLKRHHHY